MQTIRNQMGGRAPNVNEIERATNSRIETYNYTQDRVRSGSRDLIRLRSGGNRSEGQNNNPRPQQQQRLTPPPFTPSERNAQPQQNNNNRNEGNVRRPNEPANPPQRRNPDNQIPDKTAPARNERGNVQNRGREQNVRSENNKRNVKNQKGQTSKEKKPVNEKKDNNPKRDKGNEQNPRNEGR